MTKKDLLNPFENYSESTLAIVGLIGIAVATWLTSTHNLLYLGSLKLVNNYPKEWYIALLNIGITIVANAVVLYLYAILKNQKSRAIDILNTVLIAHLPMFLLGLLMIVPLFSNAISEVSLYLLKYGFDGQDLPMSLSIILGFFALLCLIILVAFFYYIVVGTKLSMNSKGGVDTIVVVILVLLLNTVLQIFNPYV